MYFFSELKLKDAMPNLFLRTSLFAEMDYWIRHLFLDVKQVMDCFQFQHLARAEERPGEEGARLGVRDAGGKRRELLLGGPRHRRA